MTDDGGDQLLASAAVRAVRALRACLQSRASRTPELNRRRAAD